ncbi:MAG TPA: class I SAM-dependent methyltransferase [bacterium]|nr:class I SAM-dependent methyltransferase [bacterium]
MTSRIYTNLAEVYDALWGHLTRQYVSLVNHVLFDHGLTYVRVIDFACGTGSLACQMGKKGHLVHGIDISPAMVKIARTKTWDLPNVTFAVQDMMQFSANSVYDVATCTFDSLNYLLAETEVRTFVKAITRALKPGGLFIFDINTEHMYAHYQEDILQHNLNGKRFFQRLSYNANQKIATAVFEFTDGTMEIHRQAAYSYATIKKILKSARMRVVNAYSDFNGRGFRSGDERLICVAVKR